MSHSVLKNVASYHLIANGLPAATREQAMAGILPALLKLGEFLINGTEAGIVAGIRTADKGDKVGDDIAVSDPRDMASLFVKNGSTVRINTPHGVLWASRLELSCDGSQAEQGYADVVGQMLGISEVKARSGHVLEFYAGTDTKAMLNRMVDTSSKGLIDKFESVDSRLEKLGDKFESGFEKLAQAFLTGQKGSASGSNT